MSSLRALLAVIDRPGIRPLARTRLVVSTAGLMLRDAGGAVLTVMTAEGRAFALELSAPVFDSLGAQFPANRMEVAAPEPVRTRAARWRRPTAAESAPRLLAAWAELAAGSRDAVTSISRRHGLSPAALGTWARANHAGHFAALMRIRRGEGTAADYQLTGLVADAGA